MHRVMAMIRQGEEFGPYPLGVVTPTKIESAYIEFVSFQDLATGQRQVTRLEKGPRPHVQGGFQLPVQALGLRQWHADRQFSYPLLRNLTDAKFTLEYDIGPRLMQATVDLAIHPEDASRSSTALASDLATARAAAHRVGQPATAGRVVTSRPVPWAARP
jgi:hypothetical protein